MFFTLIIAGSVTATTATTATDQQSSNENVVSLSESTNNGTFSSEYSVNEQGCRLHHRTTNHCNDATTQQPQWRRRTK